MKNNNMFEFNGDDIFSSSNKAANQIEDIVSDSSRTASKGKHYIKKKRGLSGFFSRTGRKISRWWGRCAKWEKASIITLTSIVLVFAIGVGVLRIVFNYNYRDITTNPDDLGFENVINEKIVNVALFGIDARDKNSFKGLSDSIMILSINTETKIIKVISIMRDSLVPITYNGKTTYTKINSAYYKGGPELAIKTLNSNFGLDISEYATVNFYGMSDIIDAVGGIDVTLAEGELNKEGYDNGHKANFGINGMIQEQCKYMNIDPGPYYVTKAGLQHLNGIQAVAYARIRHVANADGVNNDQGRTDRQRYVMEQLFNKAVTLSKTQYVKLAKALIPCSETSLSYTEIMGLAFNVLLNSPKFEQTRVPLDKYQMPSPSTGSYVYYDLDYASKIIHAFIYDNIKPEDYMETNGITKNDWYAKRYSSGNTSSKVNGGLSSSQNSSSNNSSSSEADKPGGTIGNSGEKGDSFTSGNSGSDSLSSNSEPTNPSTDDSSGKPSDGTSTIPSEGTSITPETTPPDSPDDAQ